MRQFVFAGLSFVMCGTAAAQPSASIYNRPDVQKGIQTIVNFSKSMGHEACFSVTDHGILFSQAATERDCAVPRNESVIAIVHTHLAEAVEEPSPADKEVGNKVPVFTVSLKSGHVYVSDKDGTKLVGFFPVH
jgi:hypothetical protein